MSAAYGDGRRWAANAAKIASKVQSGIQNDWLPDPVWRLKQRSAGEEPSLILSYRSENSGADAPEPRPLRVGPPVVEEIGAVRLRRFPAPFRAMLAISSDIDRTTIHSLRSLHRFMNTQEETPIGPGLGLDFANSMWMFGTSAYDASFWRWASAEVAYWKGRKIDTEKAPYAEELMAYARHGWIDTLHSYGNFSRTMAEPPYFSRDLAKMALDELERHDVKIEVWTNHGNRTNVQNIGVYPFMEGDQADTISYHADLFHAHGGRFINNITNAQEVGHNQIIEPFLARDGRFFHGFSRFTTLENDDESYAAVDSMLGGTSVSAPSGRPQAILWNPQTLHLQLQPRILERIIRRGSFTVMGQHLGSMNVQRDFDPAAVAALRRLKSLQDDGQILVARTSRLLRYAANREALRWSAYETEDGVVVDIEQLVDLPDGARAPTVEDLRGVTFETSEPARLKIAICGRLLDETEVSRTQDGDASTVGVKWHTPDTTDWSEPYRRRDPYRQIPGYPIEDTDTMRLKELNEKALKWLAEVGETRYKNANDKDAYAHRYTVGRYKIGLEHYAKLFDHIGLTGRGPGLDVGSGSGHWVNAYAALNERGEGVELREEFVELANGVTEAIGMADRSKHLVGDAKALPYEPESFDAVWSHGVMMFVEHDRMLFEMNRVLRDKNHIYLAYTALGSRVFTLSQPGQEPAALRLRAVAAQTIFNAKLYELGVYLTPNGRTRAYTREQLQYAAQYCGFTTVSTPGLQDAARRWHGVESTIDMVAKKQSDVFRHLETIVRAAGGTDGVIAEAEKATRTGAPESAIGMLDIAGIGMDDAPGRRANIAARMKAGRIQRYVDPALDNLETDETDAGRILHATAAVNFSNWKEAQKRLDKAPRTQDMEFLRLAMLIGSKKPVEALAQAEKLAEAAPRDIYMRVGLIRALMDANDPDRLYAETRQFVQDVEDDKIDISKI